MSRSVPEELVPVLARLGHEWPQADEEGLRRAAGVWREFGAEAERLSRRGGDSAQRVTGENSGQAVDAFAAHWRGFTGGGRGSLDDAQSAADLVAAAFDRAAGAVDSCKAEIIAALHDLAEEIKVAQKVEAVAHAALGVIGDAIADVVVGAGELVAVQMAKHKVGNLLEELGREMKEGLQQALKEPPVVALERIAQADGYATRAAHSAGAAAAGALLGGRAVAGVRMLSAKVGRHGELVTDAQGQPVIVDEQGKQVRGVEGLMVAKDAQGRPVVGDDGRVAVLGTDGKPVVGLAVDAEGRPLRDGHGGLALVGTGGLIAAAGVSVALGHDGKPLLGTDGEVVVLDQNGAPVRGTDGHVAKLGADGALVTDSHGRTVMVDDQGNTVRGPEKSGAGVGVNLGGVGVDLQVGPGGVDADIELKEHDNRHGQGRGSEFDQAHGHGPDPAGGRGPLAGVQVQAGPLSASVQADPFQGGGGHSAPVHGNSHGSSSIWGDSGSHRSEPAAQVGGGYGPQRPTVSVDYDYGYDSTPSAPVHHGPASVRTDSVAVAPSPVNVGPVHGDAGSAPVFGGRPGGESSLPAGGAPSGLGPVSGGGGAPAGPVGAPPVAPPPAAAAAPVAAAPSTPVAAGTPGAPGAAGGAGAGGQSGVVGAVGAVGAPQHAPGAGQGRPLGGPPQAVGLVPNPLPTHPGSSGAAAMGAVPLRAFEVLPEARRRDGESLAHPAQAAPVAAMFLIAHSYRRTAPEQPGERQRARIIADGRPYGAAGGLGPVDPAHQAELERRVPRDPEGAPSVHPDPRFGDWPEALNAGGFREPGRANNGLDLALSALDSYLGNITCGAPRLPDGPAGEFGGRDRAERELGTQFKDLGYGAEALGQLAEVLRRCGSGAQAVLLTLDEYGRSHTWNAFVSGETLTYLDPQTGYRSAAPLHPADQGLWAIALEASGRPLDLSALQPSIPVVELTPAPAPDPLAKPVPEPPAPPRSRLTIHRNTARSARR
ncbi:toxin glutamine deamidase domain-containing protein [Kitasatospora sp. NPDC002040]|uniref:toxin glutamine deamidase domain-containing protein n=1 Tax=Kitasatospora sp. NPDC002040 TaxID=3154661 RepID=UPI00331A8EAC